MCFGYLCWLVDSSKLFHVIFHAVCMVVYISCYNIDFLVLLTLKTLCRYWYINLLVEIGVEFPRSLERDRKLILFCRSACKRGGNWKSVTAKCETVYNLHFFLQKLMLSILKVKMHLWILLNLTDIMFGCRLKLHKSSWVDRIQIIKKFRGHRNVVYCGE